MTDRREPPRPTAQQRTTAAQDDADGLYGFSARLPDGTVQHLAEYRGRLTLVVNTASRCGFREQFRGLEELHRTYGPRGFTVLAFPCDQFMHQEPGEDEEVEEHCRSRWDLTFPIFAKVDVNGPSSHPVFAWLRGEGSGFMGGRIAWNFTKFLVGADGHVIRRYAPPIPPSRIARRIEVELDSLPPR